MSEQRKLKVGDKVKLVGAGWNDFPFEARDKIVTVVGYDTLGSPYSDNPALGSLGTSDGLPFETRYRVELVEDEVKPEQQFKPGDKVHVEFDAVVSIDHISRLETSYKVVSVTLDGAAFNVSAPLDGITKIAEPLPTGIGAVIRHKRTGNVYTRVSSDYWGCDDMTLSEKNFVWEKFHDNYEILREGVQL